VTLDDWARFHSIAEHFKFLMGFIEKCGMDAVRSSPEYQALETHLRQQRSEAERIRQREQRRRYAW
jgi:hypothetical protein